MPLHPSGDSHRPGRHPVDLLVRNGYVVTMDDDRRVFADGAVAVTGGAIFAIGPTDEVLATVEPARTVNAHGGLVHPGFVECHTHATYHLERGAYGDTVSYDVLEPWFDLPYLNAVDDDAEHSAALLSCLEMVGNGTTCFLEAGTAFEPAAVASAAEAIGIRALVADPWLWDVTDNADGYNALQLERAPVSTKRALGLLGSQLYRNADSDALVRGHIAIQGMGTASDQLERAAKAAADSAGTILNQHQSYYDVDAATDDRRHGRHPLVHLEDIGVLGNNCTFAHMNVIRDDEVEPIVRSGMTIVWCPAGSMLWGVGGTTRGRHAHLYKEGVNIALGSDSSNWSNSFDLGVQGYLAVLTAREKTGDRTTLVAEDALAMATINGAKAVGLEQQIGSLTPGKRADFVIRANDVPEMFPTTDPISNLVYSARSKSVHTVVVNGRIVIDGRQPVSVDPVAIYESVQSSVARVFDRMGYRFEPKWLPVDSSSVTELS
jgi:5-methylthioadenosine/S-adenosylhomocysteine deaminase